MKSSSLTRFSHHMRTFFETQLWYALLAIPVLFVFGKIITIPIASFQYEITLTEIVIAAVSTLCFGYLLSPQYRSAWRATPLGHALVLLFLMNLVSVLWVESLEKWIIAIRVLTYQYATFFIVANLIKTKQQALTALSVMVVPAVICGIYIMHVVSGIPYSELATMNRAHIVTPVGALSLVAAMVAFFIPITLGVYHMANRLAYRMALSGVYIFLLAALLSAAGKAAILSAACGIVCMVALVRQRRAAIIGLTLCSVLLFFSATSFRSAPEPVVVSMPASPTPTVPAPPPVPSAADLLLSRFSNISTDPSTQFRLLELETAGLIFLASPLAGQGAGNLKVAYHHYTGFYDGEANNIIVQYGAEFGALGLALFGFALYHLGRLYAKEYLAQRKTRPLMMAIFSSFLVTVAINAMFEVTVVGLIYGILFWYAVGIFSAYSKARS